jgi:hypothetical protein
VFISRNDGLVEEPAQMHPKSWVSSPRRHWRWKPSNCLKRRLLTSCWHCWSPEKFIVRCDYVRVQSWNVGLICLMCWHLGIQRELQLNIT